MVYLDFFSLFYEKIFCVVCFYAYIYVIILKYTTIMKVAFYLNENRKKNLYCRISDGVERVTFSLDYCVDAKKWDPKKEEFKWDSIKDELTMDECTCNNILLSFRRYLNARYQELKNDNKSDILSILKNESLSFLSDGGLQGIEKNVFNFFNKGTNIPDYEDFVKAFEKYSKLTRKDFTIHAEGTEIYFHTKDESYVMDSYEGQTKRLKNIIENDLYDEIFTETELNIWSEIYLDAGIEKHVFLPEMLKNWEGFWDKKYNDIKLRMGKTDRLDEMKKRSWRMFQVYMECYDGHGDSIRLASDIDYMELYPISVITMMNIFNADVCYSEYCEHKFYGSEEWESVSLDEEDMNAPVFYVKPFEM